MSEFVDNPSFYQNVDEYYKASCKHTLYMMELSRQEQLQRIRSVTTIEKNQFCNVLKGLRLAPTDETALTMQRTAVFSAPAKRSEQLQRKFEEENAALALKWCTHNYVPVKPFLKPLTVAEVAKVCARLDVWAVKALVQGDVVEDCISWKGMRNNNKPMFERTRSKEERKQCKKRCIGSVQELLLHFFVEPVLERTCRCKMTCKNPRCVNPYHVTCC